MVDNRGLKDRIKQKTEYYKKLADSGHQVTTNAESHNKVDSCMPPSCLYQEAFNVLPCNPELISKACDYINDSFFYDEFSTRCESAKTRFQIKANYYKQLIDAEERLAKDKK